jgi:hypothetical protein
MTIVYCFLIFDVALISLPFSGRCGFAFHLPSSPNDICTSINIIRVVTLIVVPKPIKLLLAISPPPFFRHPFHPQLIVQSTSIHLSPSPSSFTNGVGVVISFAWRKRKTLAITKLHGSFLYRPALWCQIGGSGLDIVRPTVHITVMQRISTDVSMWHTVLWICRGFDEVSFSW